MMATCVHRTFGHVGTKRYGLFTCSIPEVSLINNLRLSTSIVNQHCLPSCFCRANVSISEDGFSFSINSDINLNCFVTMHIGSETLYSNTIDNLKSGVGGRFLFHLVKLSPQNECFQKLKQHHHDTLVIICKIKYDPETASLVTTHYAYKNKFGHLKMAVTALESSFLNDQVVLRVGQDSLDVSKGLLCAQSPVFAQMFQSDMKELKENIVTINDIKIDVLKALVSFLYYGKLRDDNNFDFLCDLYCAADKYNLAGLLQLCVDSLLTQITVENAIQVLEFAILYTNMQLKFSALTLIAENIETFVSTEDWKNLVDKKPKLALEVLKFIDL